MDWNVTTGFRRLVVVGGPGSGKSTLARSLATQLECPHVELDALWWQPGWIPSSTDEFVSRVREAISGSSWVLDGNYLDEIASIVWPAADAVVWLDPPRHRAVRRAVMRTARRWAGRQHLWNGNREHWHNLTPASIRRLVDHWPDYPARIEQMAARLRPARTIRLRHDREVRFLLSQCHDRAVVVQ